MHVPMLPQSRLGLINVDSNFADEVDSEQTGCDVDGEMRS